MSPDEFELAAALTRCDDAITAARKARGTEAKYVRKATEAVDDPNRQTHPMFSTPEVRAHAVRMLAFAWRMRDIISKAPPHKRHRLWCRVSGFDT